MATDHIEPLVSVVMITYGHEEFIKEAIEGVLSQETEFQIELIIADDHSPDDTYTVVKDIINTHPRGNKIKYTKHEHNKGIMPNFIWALEQSRGKYIALCEGDDYWIDPFKLQKQINILNDNSDLSACTHLTKIIYDKELKSSHLHREFKKNVIRLKDLTGSMPFHTSSILFRKKFLRNLYFPDKITSGDKALSLFLAMCGPIYMLNNLMSVYRKNEGGVSQNLNPASFKNDIQIAKWAKSMDADFPSKDYKSYLYYTMLAYPKNYSLMFFIKNYILYLYYTLIASPRNMREISKNKVFSKALKQKKIDKLV